MPTIDQLLDSRFFSKLIKRAVHRQLSTHLTAFHLLPDRQSAYRTNYSTETALLGLYNDLLCNADADLTTAFCFLDLSAAFDTIDPNILLDSLATRCGIVADALLWFASYLSGRTQCVRVGDCQSSSVPVPVGVPQGSVNGSILFILLVSDLPEQTTTDGVIIDQYSDDTNGRITFKLLSKDDHSDQRAAIASLGLWTRRTDGWLFDQHVILNLSKSLFFYAVSPHQAQKLALLPLDMSSCILQPSAEVKHLGVTFDSHLTMSSHIRNICRSSFFHLWRIGKVRRFLDPISFFPVQPLFVGLPGTLLSKLQRVINASARLILRVRKSDSIRSHLRSLNWLCVNDRITFRIATLTYRCLNGSAPSYLSRLIFPLKNSRSLRSSLSALLRVPRTHNVNFGDRSFAKVAPSIWNQLLLAVRNAPSFLKFRSLLFKHLFD